MTIFCNAQNSNIYIVKTNPENSRHRGLLGNPSQYLLTFWPKPGDEIEFVLPGTQYTYAIITGLRSWRVLSWNYSLSLTSEGRTSQNTGKKKIVISSCPGYACTLGEDTWDDAVDQPILKDLIQEAIGPFSDCDWRYAPVNIKELDPWDSSAPSYLYYRITSEGGCTLISEEQYRKAGEFAIEEAAKIDFENSQDEQSQDEQRPSNDAIASSPREDEVEEEMDWEEEFIYEG